MSDDFRRQIHIAEQGVREHGIPNPPIKTFPADKLAEMKAAIRADLAPYFAEMRELWLDGFDTLEIAQALGLTEAQVYNGRKYFAHDSVALPDAAAEGAGT